MKLYYKIKNFIGKLICFWTHIDVLSIHRDWFKDEEWHFVCANVKVNKNGKKERTTYIDGVCIK